MNQTETPKRRNPRKIAGTALLIGIMAGAAVLYVRQAPSGNQPGSAPEQSACVIDKDRSAALAAAAKGDVAAMLPAADPQSLTALQFNGPDGKPVSLKTFAGKTVLLNLWATWCVPCREEMPHLDSLQASMGSEVFEVVAVNVDTGSDEKPRKFLNEIGIEKLTFYQDPTLGIFNDLKKRGLVLGLPVTLLVDAEGCLLAGMNGPANWGGEDARAFIAVALGEGIS